MLGSLQADAVALLDAARTSPPAGGWPAEWLPPRAVRPYLAELQDVKTLTTTLPVVFVELTKGGLAPMGDVGTLRGEHVLTLVCCARNLAGREAAAHDGARLADWCLQALRAAGLRIGRRRVSGIAYSRLLSDRQLWACRLDLALDATS